MLRSCKPQSETNVGSDSYRLGRAKVDRTGLTLRQLKSTLQAEE